MMQLSQQGRFSFAEGGGPDTSFTLQMA